MCDLAPTFIELAAKDANVKNDMDGRSFAQALKAEEGQWKKHWKKDVAVVEYHA